MCHRCNDGDSSAGVALFRVIPQLRFAAEHLPHAATRGKYLCPGKENHARRSLYSATAQAPFGATASDTALSAQARTEGLIPFTRSLSQDVGGSPSTWKPTSKVDPFFAGSEHPLWPLHFPLSGIAIRPVPEPVPIQWTVTVAKMNQVPNQGGLAQLGVRQGP